MKKLCAIIFCLTLAVLLFGCSRNAERILYVYHWEDYINPDLITEFEKRFKCKVEIDIFGSLEELNENLIKGEKIYDVIFPSNSTAREMYENRMLKDIDHSKIPNLKNLDLGFVKRSPDSYMKYSIPYMTSFTGIAYNKKRVKDFKPTWAMFSRPDMAGRIALLTDGREVIGAASKALGYSYNGSDDIQLRKAMQIVQDWKKNGVKFDNSKSLERHLISGKYDMIQDYSGNAAILMSEHPEIGFALPNEGGAVNLDNFAIPFASNNTELAYAFINFFLDAENAKENMLYVRFPAPNLAAKALLPEEFLNNRAINPPESILLRSEHIAHLGDNEEKYRVLWRTVIPK